MEENLQTIHAEVLQEVFFAEDTNYRILRTRVTEQVADFAVDDSLTVTGYFPEIKLNQQYVFQGEFREHSKYGHQFAATIATENLPKEKDNIVQYIKNLEVPGVGIKTIEKLYDHLGKNILEQLAQEGLEAIKSFHATGWNDLKAAKLIASIQSEQAVQLYFFKLIKYGFPSHIVAQLHEQYGEDLETVIQTNCYQILEDFDGISIKMIDKIVQNHFDEQLKFRTKYAIVYYIKNLCYQSGNSMVTFAMIVEALRQDTLSLVEPKDIEEKLQVLLEEKKVYKLKDNFYQVDFFHFTERNIATRLKQLDESEVLHPNQKHHIELYIKECEDSFGIDYAVEQKKALMDAFSSNVYLLTGGPGTGKTTIIKALLEIFTLLEKASSVSDERILQKIALLAPTGRAAQRMLETTGFSAQTIHRFLGWDKHKNQYRFNDENPISEVEFVIVDESSMIDMWLLSALLKALPNIGHIIFVGDKHQLPSVGCGQVFADMLNSQAFSITMLEKIFRQKNNSTIIDVATQINSGEPSSIFFENSEDYSFLSMQPAQLLRALEQICTNALNKGYTFEEIQILAPLYKSNVGINAINKHLQHVFNVDTYGEDERYETGNDVTFLPNDKVIQLKNLPEFDVFNGDIGRILSIEKTSSTQYEVVIDFSGTLVIYSREEMKLIAHAYCISIHKSQGSEFPLVIIPVFFQYSIMLYRQLIYTGASRAKKALIFLGQQEALLQAVKNTDKHQRLTGLHVLLDNTSEATLPQTLSEAYQLGQTGEDLNGLTPWSFLEA